MVVPHVLDADVLARVRGALDDLVAKANTVDVHSDIYDLESGHTAHSPKVRCIKKPHTHPPIFWEVAQYSKLVDTGSGW